MTSSLVGSEMCIRDSPFSRRTPDQVHVPKEQLAQAAANYLSTIQWPAPRPTGPAISHQGLIIADHLHFDT
eukprot:3556512-Prorocentrum_lima.AAC.1